MDRGSSIRFLKGVGPGRAAVYEKMGIKTVGDLCFYLPRAYQDRTDIRPIATLDNGETATFRAIIASEPRTARLRKGLSVTRFFAADETGMAEITFFNRPYMDKSLRLGEEYTFYGVVNRNLLKVGMTSPEMERVKNEEEQGRMVAVYRLSSGISQNMIRGHVREALAACTPIEEYISREIREKYGLMPLWQAILAVHMPKTAHELKEGRRRLSFDELFLFQLRMLRIKGRRAALLARPLKHEDSLLEYYKILPFAPTKAQARSMEEIICDLKEGTPMSRMLQGDVGSGKTIVAGAGIFHCVKSGGQAALMVPTELLATQHFAALGPMMEGAGIRTVLLTASTPAPQKRRVREELKKGEVGLVIGTHALLSHEVEFKSLDLCVTDEQHRFGVRQRASLAAKGSNPHVLVMSATPIPRTLGFVLYGDLDISIIDELPPGRGSVDTFLVNGSMRQRVRRFIEGEAKKKNQTYIVCPAIEEREEGGRAAVESYVADLKKAMPALKIDCVHGRQRPGERGRIMAAFAAGDIDVLVSTTVIEVGIDVKRATVMVIENAECFGLSQLHQLRGRVGRGTEKSYCILFSDAKNKETITRLEVMKKTRDGFEIAKLDFELRGPGDFFGERQHGAEPLKFADVWSDANTLYQSREAALELTSRDPELKEEKNAALIERINLLFYGDNKDIFN